jgi:DNA modification methylase
MKALRLNTIINDDCLNVLKEFPDNCIDLIITSPPYANSRRADYGGISPGHYVKWLLPRTKEFLRVLKPKGTFIINIKEKVVNGERHTYVIELILEMRRQGWLWTEEFIWHKKNSYPGKWPNRFRDAWERCLQFNKMKKFNMYQEAVKIPIGKWAESRLSKLNGNDVVRVQSNTKSGFSRRVANWAGRRKVYPTNVLHLPTECANKEHSATFPLELPKWFIKLFTKKDDIVLDPFVGSGTTAIACKELSRNYIGIDIDKNICNLTRGRL